MYHNMCKVLLYFVLKNIQWGCTSRENGGTILMVKVLTIMFSCDFFYCSIQKKITLLCNLSFFVFLMKILLSTNNLAEIQITQLIRTNTFFFSRSTCLSSCFIFFTKFYLLQSKTKRCIEKQHVKILYFGAKGFGK